MIPYKFIVTQDIDWKANEFMPGHAYWRASRGEVFTKCKKRGSQYLTSFEAHEPTVLNDLEMISEVAEDFFKALVEQKIIIVLEIGGRHG